MTDAELLLFFKAMVKMLGGVESAGRYAGVGKSSISNYQRGSPLPPVPVICRLEAELGLPFISQRMLESTLDQKARYRPMEKAERTDRMLKECTEAIRGRLGKCPSLAKKEIMEGVTELLFAYLDVEHEAQARPVLVVSNDSPSVARLPIEGTVRA